MQIQAYLQRPMLPAAAASLLFSAALFGLLYSVIRIGHHTLEKPEALQTIDFVRLKRDSEVETLARHKPPPPPVQPPPPEKMRVAAQAVQQDGLSVAIPNLNLSATVGGGPIAGKMGGGGAAFDGDLFPLQRIPPQYPRDAARANITGWVVIEVLVNADGTVRSARVTDAKPKGLFEASAVQAILRWKFKPKIQNGIPVEQRGSQKIEFNLNQPAAS